MFFITVVDYEHPAGWKDGTSAAERARWYCEQLEAGEILFFERVPFDLPKDNQHFLLSQRQSDLRFHKNVSYRPKQDVLRGFKADGSDGAKRLHAIMRGFSHEVTRFLTQFLAAYAPHWSLDFASFRPLEEHGRDLPLHKRNDLLHVDAFPTRPTHGGRILRVFTNINPTQNRVWETGEPFHVIAPRSARDAGLEEIAGRASSPTRMLVRALQEMKRAVGLRVSDHSAYDLFMLRFHDYLKENADFQQHSPKTRMEFPPGSTWMAFLDGVPHAVLSGQFALEQTYIVPLSALVAPERAPIRVLEGLCGRKLADS